MTIKNWKIYTLKKPDTNEVRYIGVTTVSLKSRLSGHLHEARSGKKNTYKANWIKKLLLEGIIPEIEEIDHGVGDDYMEAEKDAIRYYRLIRDRLTNATDGGEGVSGYKPTPEVIERIRLKKIGTKHSEESRARRSAWMQELVKDESYRSKISNSMKGYVKSPEHRRKLSESHKGKIMSPEARRNMSIGGKGKKMPPRSSSAIEATRIANTGKKASLESRIKMSESHKNRAPMTEEARKNMSSAQKLKQGYIRMQKLIASQGGPNALVGHGDGPKLALPNTGRIRISKGPSKKRNRKPSRLEIDLAEQMNAGRTPRSSSEHSAG